MANKTIGLIASLLTLSITVFSQSKEDLEQLAASPKTVKTFPLNYKIALPRAEYKSWDADFNRYYAYLTPALRHTQATLTYTDKKTGVITMLNPNSILPHAQLDTGTIIPDPSVLAGTWRMLAFRSVRFNDSVDITGKTCNRMPDTLLEDRSSDEAFAIFSGNQFKLYARDAGKKHFKKIGTSKFQIENRRYLMLYKWSRSGSGVSQIGIDEQGYLIVNYPKVIEIQKKGIFISFYAVIEQYIFEKAKQ